MHVLIRGEDLLRRNVLGNMDLKNSIMEVVWRSQEFRLAIAQKIDETMQLYGNSIHKSSKESESFIYKKARNKNEYLESAARILLHLRERSLKNSTLSTSINCNSKLINETKLFPSVPLSFLIHSLSYVLLFNSGFQIYNGFEALFKSDISFDIFLRNLGLLTYPLNKLELAIERQNEFMEGFNTVQEEEKKLEKLMIHAKLQKLNGHIKDYENTIRNIETKAMESNCQLQDIMDGFPLQDHEMIALIINFKDIFHHILLILYHLGYVFGYVGSNCRLGALVLHGFIGIQAHTYIEWDFNHWMLNVMKTVLRICLDEDITLMINSKNAMGFTGLHLLSIQGHTELAQQLLGNKKCAGLDVNTESEDLGLAFSSGQYDLFNELYEKKRPFLQKFPDLDAYVKRFNANLVEFNSNTTHKKYYSPNLEFYISKINEAFSEASNIQEESSPSSILEFFECPICFEEMRTRIYACIHDHWLCSDCFENESVDSCPTCRISFSISRNYYRANNAEKIANILFN
ncbi:SIAH1 [Lepeophtheirus salmonis]|uniref:Mediator of RNA polymerase II transcription subunit 15 n=1 Tax=Lepeophtheirus salmonis TaxID=72036 RepID=A0A7R8CCL6_LEPSM|nr:SIAH1 [Lepeophtheirus salmonis]CAF2772452.1 SIAH1 [Lepeophtheirus salmonis]